MACGTKNVERELLAQFLSIEIYYNIKEINTFTVILRYYRLHFYVILSIIIYMPVNKDKKNFETFKSFMHP